MFSLVLVVLNLEERAALIIMIINVEVAIEILFFSNLKCHNKYEYHTRVSRIPDQFLQHS